MILTVALVMTSCNRKTIYHHYQHTPLSGWEKNDTLLFTVKPAKERAVVQRDVELRTSGDFPFCDLFIIVEQTTFPSNIMRRDTLDCKIFDSKGNILAGGISLYQYSFHLTDISVNEGDSLSFRVRHNMKRDILPGIADVGIRLTAY